MLYLLGAFDDAVEEEGGDFLRLPLLELVTAGKSNKSGAGLRYGGEDGAKLGELC